MKRREFVAGTAATGAVLASGIVVIGCGNAVEPAPSVELPVTQDNKIVVQVPRFPALASRGGAITVRPENWREGLPEAILLVHRGDPNDPPLFVAVNASCPHKGCPLGYMAAEDTIACPCHKSQFRAAPDPNRPGTCIGDVLHAPAVVGPTVYGVDIVDGETVRIDLRVRSCKPQPSVVSGKLTLALADFPALETVGGFEIVIPENFGDPIALVRQDQATIVALNATCTHTGCTIAFAPAAMRMECPCHGSAFNLDGAVVNGPAKDPVAKYPTTFDGTTIVVTVS